MDFYGLPLDEFVKARDAEAKRTGDKSLKALRKPTVAAWLVNQLVRHEKQLIDDLLELADLLRKAQNKLDAEGMRELNEQRRQLLRALGRECRALGSKLGQKVSQAVEEEVLATLSAALADKALARQVREGRLTEALHFSGFGDLTAIVPPPRPPEQPNRLEEELERLRSARTEWEKAQKRVEGLQKELRRAEEEEERARARFEELEGGTK